MSGVLVLNVSATGGVQSGWTHGEECLLVLARPHPQLPVCSLLLARAMLRARALLLARALPTRALRPRPRSGTAIRREDQSLQPQA